MSVDRSLREDFSVPRVVGFVAALGAALVLLPTVAAPPLQAEAASAQVAARAAGKDLRGELAARETPPRVRIDYTGPEHLRASVQDEFRHEKIARVDSGPADIVITARGAVDSGRVKVAYVPSEVVGDDAEAKFEGEARVGGYEAVLPPLIAILVALFFRRLLVALGAAVWLGGAIAVGGNPLTGLWHGLSTYVWGSVAQTFNIYIIAFTLTLVGLVQLVTRMGGIAGLLERFQGFTRTRRSARITTAALGGAIFFDDYANTIVVGSSMRPITDARGISREKLAYIVDSTSAPIAGLAIISTWVGYEVGLFGELSEQLGLGRSGYDIFFSIIALRFYCLLTLVFVVANAVLGRDYGPMLRAERRAAQGDVARAGASTLATANFAAAEPAPGIPHRWINAVLPVGFVVFAAVLGMFWSGWSAGDATIPALFGGDVLGGWSAAAPDLLRWSAWRDAFGNADSAKVLFWSSAGGALLAFALAFGQRLLSPREAVLAFGRTIPMMWLAVTILVLAWSIRAVCDDLGTSIYLVGVVRDLLAPTALPIVTFLLAAVVAFATGTSWGTMGILLPAMVPLAFYLTQGSPDAQLILFLCFGAVLDGAIFGDHCSPISDTTVMSSISSGCDHLDHVRTQAPYAVTTMIVAGLFGYVGVAFGLPPVAALVLGSVTLIGTMLAVGRSSDTLTSENPTPTADAP